MPKVTVSNKKGLVQSGGGGFVIKDGSDFTGGLNVSGAGQATTTAGNTGTSNLVAVRKSADAAGLHTYQEEVSLAGAINTTNSAVICELSKTLPANAKIVDCGITATTLSDLASVIVQLTLSATADTAQGTAVDTPTVVVGAGGAAEGSGALVASTGGTAGDTEYRVASQGEFIDVAALTSVYVASDGTANTADTATAGRCLVTIRYYGSAAPA